MAITSNQKKLIQNLFSRLEDEGGERLSKPNDLAEKLRGALKKAEDIGDATFSLTAADAVLFGSAAVEIWLRAVHSFLISNSLLKTSKIWASVSGYYASHYVMRAFSHLLGHYLLGRQGQVVTMRLDHGFYCDATRKKKTPTEHQYYWEVPRREIGDSGNLLFSDNAPMKDEDFKTDKVTDGIHRVCANYFDHVNNFVDFDPLDELYLKDRLSRLSELVTDSPTIPDYRKFPDIDKVQIIAYARIVLFRKFLDEIVGPKNRYWGKYRNPSWFQKYMTFQLPEGSTLSALNNVLSNV